MTGVYTRNFKYASVVGTRIYRISGSVGFRRQSSVGCLTAKCSKNAQPHAHAWRGIAIANTTSPDLSPEREMIAHW